MRTCTACGTEITVCMGFVKAGDLMELWEGGRAKNAVRELCGKCALPALNVETHEELVAFLERVGWGVKPRGTV